MQDNLIEIIQKQNPNLTSHMRHILDDLIGLRLSDAEIIFVLSVFLDQIHKCIDCKGIVLCGHAKLLLAAALSLVFILQDRCLLQYLPCITEKLLALLGQRNPAVRPVKYHKIHFLFQFMNRVGQTRLGNIKLPRCLCDRSGLRHHDHISKLLKCHINLHSANALHRRTASKISNSTLFLIPQNPCRLLSSCTGEPCCRQPSHAPDALHSPLTQSHLQV